MLDRWPAGSLDFLVEKEYLLRGTTRLKPCAVSRLRGEVLHTTIAKLEHIYFQNWLIRSGVYKEQEHTGVIVLRVCRLLPQDVAQPVANFRKALLEP